MSPRTDRSRRRSLPASVWVGNLGLVATVLLLGSTLGTLAIAGADDVHLGAALLGILIGMGVVVGAIAFLAHSGGRSLIALRREAVGLRLPTDLDGASARRLLLVRELGELVRTVDALHLRVRVSDDVAERHRLSAERASTGMSRLVEDLVRAEEGARGQLAAELHDTVAQSLLLARHALDATVPDVARVGDLVSEAEEQLRGVMARALPPQLREGDLAEAVRLLLDDLELRYGLVVSVSWPGDPIPLPLVTAVTVYRFLQESLVNVVKHADVDLAEIVVEIDRCRMTAWVGDRGVGIDLMATPGPGGRQAGLGLLRERARAAGGHVEVRPRDGGGTVTRLELPVPPLARDDVPVFSLPSKR
jgi:signal transduction histidine kinase